uniref:Uncharacterized protein n=1 Tax=Anopheles merus TaxID=30066 RepID=A0A182UU62_ANOME
MKHRAALLVGLAVLVATVGRVAPAEQEDPLSQLLLFGDSAEELVGGRYGGQAVTGPISIRDSIVGDIISISVRVNSTVRANVSLELVQIVVCALNEYGHYGIEMADVRQALARCAICLALASGDPITISGNTIGDLVNVNVNVTANIQNEINQDYVNILALLLSSTGDVELFRRLSHAAEETDAAPSTMAPSTDAKAPSPQSQPKQDIDIEEALRKLFPKLVNKQ